MAAIVFDVRSAERRLLDAGASRELAEATADLMSEAVVHNLDALVTKDYLEDIFDARFSRQDEKLEKRFYSLESMILELKGQLRLSQAIQALLLAGVFLPQIRSLFA
jgi:hypothetical protein